MGKLFNLKQWLTIEDAAEHLSTVCGEEVTEADVLRLALDGHLTLSVNFVNHARAKRGKVVSWMDTEWRMIRGLRVDCSPKITTAPPDAEINKGVEAPTQLQALFDEWAQLPEEEKARTAPLITSINIGGERYLTLDREVRSIKGVWDLPMIGGERLDVEHQYQCLTGGPAVTLETLEGSFVERPDGQMCQLQESFDNNECKPGSRARLEELKQHIAINKIEAPEAEMLLNRHKEDRKKYLERRSKADPSKDYYPAGGLPEDSVLVVRTEALREFEKFVEQPRLNPYNLEANAAQDSILTSPCPPATASKVKQYFRVKSDPDQNHAWWRDKMREANRNGLAECRVGQGIKGKSGTLWRPDLVAGWLVDRYNRGHEGLKEREAGDALRNFPGCEEAADSFFSSHE